MKYPRITKAWLQSHAACSMDVRGFHRLFPNGANVTARNIRAAAKKRLSVGWLVEALLGTPGEHGTCMCRQCRQGEPSLIEVATDAIKALRLSPVVRKRTHTQPKGRKP